MVALQPSNNEKHIFLFISSSFYYYYYFIFLCESVLKFVIESVTIRAPCECSTPLTAWTSVTGTIHSKTILTLFPSGCWILRRHMQCVISHNTILGKSSICLAMKLNFWSKKNMFFFSFRVNYILSPIYVHELTTLEVLMLVINAFFINVFAYYQVTF